MPQIPENPPGGSWYAKLYTNSCSTLEEYYIWELCILIWEIIIELTSSSEIWD